MSIRFAGYAALFGRPDAVRDTIRPGAFTRTLVGRQERLPLLWQHNAARGAVAERIHRQ
jgi:HK97 family phage prohead protease